MFHRVIKPMASPANRDEATKMVNLDPGNLVAEFVTPGPQTSMPSIDSPRGTPEKDDTVVLEFP